MKTKVLFLAIAASLLVFSGCSKKDKNYYSWTNQFKTCENYIGQDSATVAQQLINEGYIHRDEAGVAFFAKPDLETLTSYVIAFGVSENKKVNAVSFTISGGKTPEDVTSTDGFVDLVKTIGAKYTTAFGTVYNFKKCSYENTQGLFSETDYSKLEANLESIANYEPRIIWNGANDSEIELERSFEDEDGFLMRFSIADGNVK